MAEYRNPNPRAFVGTNFVLDMGNILAANYDYDDEIISVYIDSIENGHLEFSMTPSEYDRFVREYSTYLSGY